MYLHVISRDVKFFHYKVHIFLEGLKNMTKSYSSLDVYYVEFKSTGQFCQIGSLILRIYELYV